MKIKIYFLLLFIFNYSFLIKNVSAQDFKTPYEISQKTETTTYQECIAYYKKLAEFSPKVKLIECGKTDIGLPLHTVIVSKDQIFEPKEIRELGKNVLLINNAIHPGEPEGVDASMMLVRDLIINKRQTRILENTVLVIIPMYNLGGALNRNNTSRVNQNGPKSYGFRGNARNLDLNRDFIKQDSKNAKSFAEIFQVWKPEIFVDNHTSNGADYQYVITLISSQKDKLHPAIAKTMTEKINPGLYEKMQAKGFKMTPYVNNIKAVPDSGIVAFLETPRYSTGYSALFNTIGYTVETHMFKPFPQRVSATYEFMMALLEQTAKHHQSIKKSKYDADTEVLKLKKMPLNWKGDFTKADTITFDGYTAGYKRSEITGQQRLFYDKSKPFSKKIPFYNDFIGVDSVEIPSAYVVPQAWEAVVNRLKTNGINLEKIKNDTILELEVYYIRDYKSRPQPYEGHLLHYDTKVEKEKQLIQLRKGDFIAKTNQTNKRFLVEVLEPQAGDSYFNWNFFDAILQQKEYFSPYYFEDLALEIIKENPEIKRDLEKAKAKDENLRENSWLQLYFIYKRSKHYEKTHLRYPIFRMMN